MIISRVEGNSALSIAVDKQYYHPSVYYTLEIYRAFVIYTRVASVVKIVVGHHLVSVIMLAEKLNKLNDAHFRAKFTNKMCRFVSCPSA